MLESLWVVHSVREQDWDLSSSNREAADAALVLAEHTDHLLRFSFIAFIHVGRPSAGNDQKKMVVPHYGAPQSVCLPEIAFGLGPEHCQVTLFTCQEKKVCM